MLPPDKDGGRRVNIQGASEERGDLRGLNSNVVVVCVFGINHMRPVIPTINKKLNC